MIDIDGGEVLWSLAMADVAPNRELRLKIGNNDRGIMAARGADFAKVGFSPDGRLLFAAHKNVFAIINCEGGQTVRSHRCSSWISDASMHWEENYVAVNRAIWNLSNRKCIREPKPRADLHVVRGDRVVFAERDLAFCDVAWGGWYPGGKLQEHGFAELMFSRIEDAAVSKRWRLGGQSHGVGSPIKGFYVHPDGQKFLVRRFWFQEWTPPTLAVDTTDEIGLRGYRMNFPRIGGLLTDAKGVYMDDRLARKERLQLSRVIPVAIDSQRKKLAVWKKGVLSLVDRETGETPLVNLPSLRLESSSGAFSAGSTEFAMALHDGEHSELRIWDVSTGEQLANLRMRGEITDVTASPDGKRFAASLKRQGNDQYAVRMWDAKTGQEALALGKSEDATSLDFSPDGKWLVAKSHERVLAWKCFEGQHHKTIGGHVAIPESISASEDGRWVVSCGAAQELTVWDTNGETNPVQLSDHPRFMGASHVAISPDGTLVASARPLQLWNPHELRLVDTVDGSDGFVFKMAFSSDGTTLYAMDGSKRRWRIGDGLESAESAEYRSEDGMEAVSPNGSFGVRWKNRDPYNKQLNEGLGSLLNVPGLAIVSDMKSGKDLFEVPAHGTSHDSCCFCSDGRFLFVIGGRQIEAWDTITQKKVASLVGHNDIVTCLAAPRKGKTIFSGSADRTIKMWDISFLYEQARKSDDSQQ